MAQVPTGTTFAVATTYGAAITVSAITNDTEAVVTTSAAHSLTNGAIVEMTSGWGRIHRRVFRIKAATGSSLTLEGVDTTSTTYFPAGLGVGSLRAITAFTPVTQVLGFSTSGGDAKQVEYAYFDNDVSYSINDGFSATSMNLELDSDSLGTAGYSALRTLTEVQTDTCLRIVARNGSFTYQPCTVALNESVQMQTGQVNRVRCAFNGNNRAMRYA